MLGTTHKKLLKFGHCPERGGSMLEVNVKPTTQTGFNLKLGYNDVTIVTLIRMATWSTQCNGWTLDRCQIPF